MVLVRPAEWNDAEAISKVVNRNGLGTLDPKVWRDGRETYPFANEFQDIPIGWVLVIDGAVAGYLDNVPMLYELNGGRLRGAIAARWAVDIEHRGQSLRLMTTFLKQKGVDLWLNVSASPTTARLMTGMKVPRIPIPDYGTPCFWALRPRAFARAALSRRSMPGAAGLAWPAGLVLLGWDVVRRSGRGRISSPVHRLAGFDDRFDSLWQRLSAAPPRLRAVRSRAVLDWRFRAELREGRVAIIATERGGTLSGYAVLVRRLISEMEMDMELYDIADIQAVGDDPVTFRDLLLASIQTAREEGADAIKFMSGTPAKRLPASKLRPHTYSLPFWQQYFKAASPEIGVELSTADAWDFSLFDTF